RSWWFWWLRGHWTEGRDRLEGAIARAGAGEAADALHARAKALAAAGYLAGPQNDYPVALARLEASAALYRALDDPSGLAYALAYLGGVEGLQGHLSAGRDYFESALELFRALGDRCALPGRSAGPGCSPRAWATTHRVG